MQLLSETGLAGFIIVFLIFLRIIFFNINSSKNKLFYKSIKFDDFELCLIACFLITLWPIIPTEIFLIILLILSISTHWQYTCHIRINLNFKLSFNYFY